MNHKPSAWESFTAFVSGKGFYLVVLLCLIAIGISGWLLVRSARETAEDLTVTAAGNTQLPEAVVSPSAPPKVSAKPSQAPEVSVKPSQSPAVTAAPAPSPSAKPSASAAPSATPAPTPAPSPSPSLAPASRVFTWPVNGAVIAPFSVEALAYDETMRDWRVHEGIDVFAAEGTRVLAAAAGTVSEVYSDELMGTTMTVDHGQGLVSVYSNLAPETAASAGDEVFTGDIIGAVGSDAAAESGRDSHLHFAMYKDGKPVDPEGYLPD